MQGRNWLLGLCRADPAGPLRRLGSLRQCGRYIEGRCGIDGSAEQLGRAVRETEVYRKSQDSGKELVQAT